MNGIEIINPKVHQRNFRHAVFDFDGTLSLIREGWQQVMTPYFVDEMAKTPQGQHMDHTELVEIAREFIDINTGKQTIYQCIELAEHVTKLGGLALDPQSYKDEYHRRLLCLIDHRLKGLADGTLKPEDFMVPGSEELLTMLKHHGVSLYLASGTDEIYVKREAELLGLTHYFDGHIYGAQRDYKTFSKKMVIDRILRENKLDGENLLGFGDGYVEIENVKSVGGFACGVASNEATREGIDEWKRNRLISVHADIIIGDFRCLEELERYIFE